MHIIRIDDRLSIADQPAPADFAAVRAAGFATILNLRPEGEDADQPGNLAEAAAARAAGLGYGLIPVTPATITEADVRAFRHLRDTAGGPVLAHCKTGRRALMLHVLAEVQDGRLPRAGVEALGQRHGLDLSDAGRWLDREAARRPQVRGFHDPRTGSVQYVVADPATRRCAIIDPVHDFDEKSGTTATTHADEILTWIAAEGLTVEWILDTHPHADHLSAAGYIKAKTGAPTAIGAHVTEVQKLWQRIYDWPELATDGRQWDRLFAEDETFRIGSIPARVIFSPGHTLASVSYVVGDAAFVHDTIFMPDSGTARADFPGGSARALWSSIQRILALPDDTRLFTGHDYEPGGRAAKWESTVAQQKAANPHLAGMDEAGFVALRAARDRSLPMPKLILYALQVNINGGRLPEPDAAGRRFLRFPLDALKGAAW